MNNLIGRQIDHYRIETLLGKGGMGAVYRAMDTNLARPVALKVMHPQYASQPRFQQRFMQEARSAARLDHPSIVTIYGFHHKQNLLYIVMELVPGISLGAYFERLARRQQVVLLKESLSIIAQVADALGYAHRQGVMHRDIKPDNILMRSLEQPDRPDEPPIRAVVTDFGLAKLLEGGIQTETGTFMGTLPYMSPEQVMSERVDGRSDIYSLGVLLFQLATGQLPFDIQSPTDAVMKHMNEAPPSPEKLQPGLPTAVAAIILKALAKKPDDRFQTGEEMASALRQSSGWLTADDVTTFAATSPNPVVSLLTQLEADSHPLPSRMDVEEAPPGSTDRLIVAQKGEPPQTIVMEKRVLTIGRSQDNDVTLDASGVSRRHARIERSETGWRIVDLGSTNGTFLEGARLLPDISDAWNEGETVRIGPFFLKWQPAGSDRPYPLTSVIQAPTGGTQVLSSSGQLGVVAHPTNVELAPGERANIQITLFNQGMLVDHFGLRLEGLPPSWVTLSDESQQLMPDMQSSLPLTIHPPQDSSARSGQHRYRLVVTSTENEKETATLSGSVTIKPLERFSVDMQPNMLRGSGQPQVQIQNNSNFENTFHVVGRDPGNMVRFEQAHKQLAIPPGQKQAVTLAVKPAKRPLLGRNQTVPFETQVSTPTSAAQKLAGQLEIRPLIPAWLISLLVLLSIILCLGGFWVWNNIQINEQAAEETKIAVAGAETAVILTQIADGANAETATWVAEQAADATATSIHLTAAAEGDDDEDGLSNADELSLGINPNEPDTDGDGLSDGEEVNQHGTDPKNQDSDGDTLSDGDEINQYNTAPKNPDTDGDGLPDGVEVSGGSDPLLPPTATPTPTTPPTATATAVVEPGNTPTATVPTPTSTITPSSTPTSLPPSQSWTHTADLLDNRQIYYLRLTGPGLISVNATWSGPQTNLAIIINGPGQVGYYARQDGSSPLQASYNVTAGDFASGDTWRVTIASFGSQRADGTVTISYPSGAASGAFTDSFAVLPDYGNITSVLVLQGSGAVNAQSTWNGSPGTLAFIINGPGQVGYYAREDGASPLSVNYTVTAADFAAGDYWRVSLAAFSDPSISNGSVQISYP